MFEKGNTVYTKDGTNYYFDHVAGEFGMVSPIILIQTASYDQQDFEEHEEPADHMIPIRLTELSKTPWVRVIHQETADAVAAKKMELDEMNRMIGSARTELRDAERVLADRTAELEREARVLERRFQWVKDFRRLIGEEDLFMMAIGVDSPDTAMPYRINPPTDIRLKKTSGTATWNYSYLGEYEEDQDHIRIFATEQEMFREVTNRFIRAKSAAEDVAMELQWHKHWPHIPLSDGAKNLLAQQELDKLDKQYEAAIARRDAAEEESTRLANEMLEIRKDK